MYKRVLLKLSGEALKGNETQIFDVAKLKEFANVIKTLHDENIEICVVIGAGNIWRGKLAEQIGINQVPADYMGMLGTIINAISLSNALKAINVDSVVYTALKQDDKVALTYNIEYAKKSLNEGKVVFLAGGTGKPFFTTDTAATMRAIELECDVILMGKNGVQGVYDKDPLKYEDAKFFDTITYQQILDLKLNVMDLTAVELIKDKDIQIRVFSMDDPTNFIKVAKGATFGTTCKKE